MSASIVMLGFVRSYIYGVCLVEYVYMLGVKIKGVAKTEATLPTLEIYFRVTVMLAPQEE